LSDILLSPIESKVPAAYTPISSLHYYQLTVGQPMSDKLFAPPFVDVVPLSSR